MRNRQSCTLPPPSSFPRKRESRVDVGWRGSLPYALRHRNPSTLPLHGRRASDRESRVDVGWRGSLPFHNLALHGKLRKGLRTLDSRVAGQSGAPPAVVARGIPLTTLCPTPSPSRPQHTLPRKAVALATRRASDPAIRPWRLRREGYTVPPCVTRPPPTPACRTQPAGPPLGAGIARKAVRRTPQTVRVGQGESYLRRTVSKLIRSPKKKTLEVERIAGVPLVLRGHPRRLLRRRRLGRAPHLPAVAPAHPPPTRPSRPQHTLPHKAVALATRRASDPLPVPLPTRYHLLNTTAKPGRSPSLKKQTTILPPSSFTFPEKNTARNHAGWHNQIESITQPAPPCPFPRGERGPKAPGPL